jgi:uncharacterized protein (DUF1778 family)
MTDKERIQLNLRLDGNKDLYEAIKVEAARQGTSVNSFVINALEAALNWQDECPATAVSLDAVLEVVEKRLDALLDEKLAEEKLLEKITTRVLDSLGEDAA